LVDKLAAVVAVKAQKGKREGLGEGGKALEDPFLGLIEQTEQEDPA
jgi:hypothetical protein